jgi:hypothetical protein
MERAQHIDADLEPPLLTAVGTLPGGVVGSVAITGRCHAGWAVSRIPGRLSSIAAICATGTVSG